MEGYLTGKTRVCVTVGMMTTGYDCEDLLNLCLMRPIFSPTDFIQIKGRGTRRHNFRKNLRRTDLLEIPASEKTRFTLFDFFANCEYFEERYNYDQVLALPKLSHGPLHPGQEGERSTYALSLESLAPDALLTLKEEQIGLNGMKVDRMFFERFGETVRQDAELQYLVSDGAWERALEYVQREILNRPEDYFTLEKLRRAVNLDRRVSLREFLEYAFGLIPALKSKDQLLDEEFEKFTADYKPTSDQITGLKYFFKAYITDARVRDSIDNKRFADLNVNPSFSMRDLKAVAPKWRALVPKYIKTYVQLE